MTLSAIDWLALFVVVASLLLGLWRGLLYEVLALAGWVIAFLAARWPPWRAGRPRPSACGRWTASSVPCSACCAAC